MDWRPEHLADELADVQIQNPPASVNALDVMRMLRIALRN